MQTFKNKCYNSVLVAVEYSPLPSTRTHPHTRTHTHKYTQWISDV